jgi:glycosyltransferase involved in cell wall biosynthesis
MVESPSRLATWWRGREDFDFPGTALLPELPPVQPDVIHCHNLHVAYFDLRQLAPLSRRVPVGLTLHDEWLLTGHCAYGLGCERWRIGCGACPDLTIYPAIRRDATAANWAAKRAIYADSQLYISAHSRWLLDRARDSALAEGALGWRLLPTGVDQAIFRPDDQALARRELGLPLDRPILLFAANHARTSVFKDSETVLAAVRQVAASHGDLPLLLIALGEPGPSERIGTSELRWLPYESDDRRLARYFQAADVFIHAAKADNFPTTILLALSCGIPVVATAVGGIPEQLQSLVGVNGSWSGPSARPEVATGVLVPPADPAAMASASAALAMDSTLRARLGANAAADARHRFDPVRQVDETIEWYRAIAADWANRRATA